jgi:electron transfer flavoprotein alpha subunit
MATVRPRVGEPSAPRPVSGEILRLECAGAAVLIELGEQVYEEAAGPRLEDAGVVVAGGRGVGGEQGFELLLELSSLLGGATGASRPACDAGWISNSLQIGITGKMVAPDVYLAVGISGSIQHLSGMLDSRKIVAINKDPEANIFTVSDYGAVGEWQQVLPAFLSGLRAEIEGRTG